MRRATLRSRRSISLRTNKLVGLATGTKLTERIVQKIILSALSLVVVAWYATRRKRFARVRAHARKEMERWENEGGASR
jgi:hypothetical protein